MPISPDDFVDFQQMIGEVQDYFLKILSKKKSTPQIGIAAAARIMGQAFVMLEASDEHMDECFKKIKIDVKKNRKIYEQQN